MEVSVCVDKKREEVRDWVIQLSMDQQVGPKLSFDVQTLDNETHYPLQALFKECDTASEGVASHSGESGTVSEFTVHACFT